ncbi:hypothetical protein [Algoriphagus namhaensis]
MQTFQNPSRYDSTQKINFGQYNGIEIGIVFLYDPEYIEWLIREVAFFCIEDLNVLLENGVINKTTWIVKFKFKALQKENMMKFKHYYQHLNAFKPYLQSYNPDSETLNKNEENLEFNGTLKIKTIKFNNDVER